MKIRVITALVCATLIPITHAQTPKSPAPTLTTRSTLVLVPALVRNKSGKLVFTLNADNFTLTDNGIPQKLNLEDTTPSLSPSSSSSKSAEPAPASSTNSPPSLLHSRPCSNPSSATSPTKSP